nr:50S ribosomal protein L4 [Candidatus Woesearchaeota archaeon]
MKANILNLEGKKVKQIDLPIQFNEEIRTDLIRRAFLSFRANTMQQYGAKPEAGKRVSAKVSRRRRDYRGSYGHGISRVPRKVLSVRGTQFYWVGALAPGTVKGRRAHPPKSEQDRSKKINIKERRKAIRAAISATINNEFVKNRGHLFTEIPLIVEDKFEDISKTSDLVKVFESLGLNKEIERVNKKKIKAGKGKRRNRKYKIKKGPLVIVSDDCKLINAAKNIIGLDVAKVNSLNVDLLAPGSYPGRLCVWSNKAIEKLDKEKLYYDKNESI